MTLQLYGEWFGERGVKRVSQRLPFTAPPQTVGPKSSIIQTMNEFRA